MNNEAQRRPDHVVAEAIRRTWPKASAETIDRLLRAGSVIEKSSGTLLAQGERPARVALIVSGTFVNTWTAPDGRVADGAIVHIDPSGPARFLGLTTLRDAPIISGIDALTPVTAVIWQSDDFRSITDADQAVMLDLLDRSIFAIRQLNYLMQLRTFTTAATRLAGVFLEHEASFFGADPPLVARGQLSALAGVTPQMVTRILRKWERLGIVRRTGPSGLELLDRAALEAEAAPLADFPEPRP